MKHLLIGTLALAGTALSSTAFSAPAATLLFSQPGTQILDQNGLPRPAKRGDVLQTGERLVTPPGAISQLRLPDGSLLGMRPDSELKIDLPPQASDQAQRTVSLRRGTVRVVGAELMDAKKPSHFTLQTGLATLKLQGADLESALVPPESGQKPGSTAAGSYNRLLVGTGSIGNGALVEPLAPRQVSFVGAVNVAPLMVTAVSPTLFTTRTAVNTTATGTVSQPDPSIKTIAPSTLPILSASNTPIAPTRIATVGPTTTFFSAPQPTVLTAPSKLTVVVAPIVTQPIYTIYKPPVTCTVTSTGLKVCR
jgi:hypothetical protein